MCSAVLQLSTLSSISWDRDSPKSAREASHADRTLCNLFYLWHANFLVRLQRLPHGALRQVRVSASRCDDLPHTVLKFNSISIVLLKTVGRCILLLFILCILHFVLWISIFWELFFLRCVLVKLSPLFCTLTFLFSQVSIRNDSVERLEMRNQMKQFDLKGKGFGTTLKWAPVCIRRAKWLWDSKLWLHWERYRRTFLISERVRDVVKKHFRAVAANLEQRKIALTKFTHSALLLQFLVMYPISTDSSLLYR